MPRFHAVPIVLALLISACRSATPGPSAPVSIPADLLRTRIDSITSTPPFDRALWGIRVEDDGGSLLYERDSARLFVPASTRKLFVAAALADCYGFDSTITTSFLMTGDVRAGILEGDVVIAGAGDPSMGGRLEFETDRDRRFRPLLEWLRANRVVRIDGGIIADVSAFDSETIHGSWKSDNIGDSYAAPVDALAFNENVVGIRIPPGDCRQPRPVTDPAFVRVAVHTQCGAEDSVSVQMSPLNEAGIFGELSPAGARLLPSVPAPALYTASALADFLRNEGIAVGGPAKVSRTSVAGTVIAEGESVPLFGLLSIVLKNSQNLYAGMLFKRLGMGGEPASYARAAEVEREFLERVVAIPGAHFRFEDGSGLSDENLVTPAALVRILRYLNRDESRREIFASLLALPGESGTLARRLLPLGDRLRAKSGSLNMVNVIAGYVKSSTSRRIRYFSVMLNHHTATGAQANAAIDGIVMAVADF